MLYVVYIKFKINMMKFRVCSFLTKTTCNITLKSPLPIVNLYLVAFSLILKGVQFDTTRGHS